MENCTGKSAIDIESLYILVEWRQRYEELHKETK